MWNEVQIIRDIIDSKLPKNTILPRHTVDAHFYEYTPTGEIFASVTTKSSILKQDHVKGWAVTKAIEHIKICLTPGSTVPEFEAYEEIFTQAQNQHVEIFEEAGDLGTKAHGIIENYLNEWISKQSRPADIMTFVPQDTDIRIISAVRAAEKFCKENHIIPIHSELLVASPKYKVAGTLDFLAFKGTVIDHGNSNCNHEMWQAGSKHAERCTRCSRKIKYDLALIDWKTSNKIDKPEYMMQVATYWNCLKELIDLKPSKITIVKLDKKIGEYSTLDVSPSKRGKAFKAYVSLTETYDWLNSPDANFDNNKKIIYDVY